MLFDFTYLCYLPRLIILWIWSCIRAKHKMRFSKFFPILFGLLQIFNCLLSVVGLEILLSHWLILRNILTISKVLGSHFLHSFVLSFLIVPSYKTARYLIIICVLSISSFISCFILYSVVTKLEMCFAQIIFNFLIEFGIS